MENNQANNIIKWVVIIIDFLILNALLYFFRGHHVLVDKWPEAKWHVFLLGSNLAMIAAQSQFATLVHRRLATAGDILKRVLLLSMTQVFLSYVILKALTNTYPIGRILVVFGPLLFVLLILSRIIERLIIKKYRRNGKNIRYVTFVGNDPELLNVYKKLLADPTKGYKFLGYYADTDIENVPENFKLERLGTLESLMASIKKKEEVVIGDDMYVCISRRDGETIRQISKFCDLKVVRFYYVPVSVESLGINLKRELLDDIDIYSTYELPLRNPLNNVIKRIFDIIASVITLVFIIPIFPIVAFMIKKQSPKGPIFFKQLRTGIDGKNFYCYKFRSMHPNKDESGRVQAKKDDPRKFPFGDVMRKTSIDELPQFWNVLKGDMSIVGPRPHPVALNEEYAKMIDKYMVRHFAKPGITGWAQVTGFRGETEELWQMEERIKRDIWYMEHWNFWLDVRIVWLTVKQVVVHNEKAY